MNEGDARNVLSTWGWARRIVAALLGAAVLVAIADIGLMIASPSRALPGVIGTSYLVAIAAAGGIAAGVALAASFAVARAVGGGRRLSLRHPGVLVVAALATAGFCYANRSLFDGDRISRHPRIHLIKPAFWVGGALLILVVARLAASVGAGVVRRGLVTRGAVASLALVGAAALYHADATRYPGQYPDIHLQLAVGAVLATAVALLVLLARPGTGRTEGALWLVGLMLVVLGPVLRLSPDIAVERTRAHLAALNVRQWMAWVEPPLDRWFPLPEGEVADVSELVRGARTGGDGPAIRARLDQLAPARRDMNLLVVSIDTLRADHVSGLGYDRRTTPRLDELMERSLVFTRCYVPYPTSAWTYSSLMSGRHPSASPLASILADREVELPADLTLAGLLTRAGRDCRAETGFNRETIADRAIFGHLAEGFGKFHPGQPRARPARAVTDSALAALGTMSPGPFFLWVHYMDPHNPYVEDPDFRFGPTDIDRYDSEIARCDHELGRLLDALESRGVADDTVVVVMSDHGEEFGEHNGRYHNSTLYEEQVRVPGVIHVPGVPASRIDAITSIVDFLPTLTSLFGLADPHPRHGRSLWPNVLTSDAPDRWAYAELFAKADSSTGDLRMVVHGNHKLIVNVTRATEEVYDLAADPRETRLAAAETEAAVLRGLLAEVRREIRRTGAVAPREAVTGDARAKELRDRMASLIAMPVAERRKELGAFSRDLTDPVFGLKREWAPLLGTAPLREEVLAFLQAAVTHPAEDPLQALPTLNLLERMDAREALPGVRKIVTTHPLIRPRVAIVRGLLGDATVADELKGLLARDGTAYKQEIASALASLGEEPGAAWRLATPAMVAPLAATRLVAGLGHRRDEGLLDIVDEHHWLAPWKYPPLRLAAVRALERLPASGRRARLLALFATDARAEVAREARRVLADAVDGTSFDAWLAAATAEGRGDEGAAFNRMDLAADGYRAADYPQWSFEVRLKLARAWQAAGDLARAREVLEAAADRGTVEQAARARARIGHLISVADMYRRKPAVTVRKSLTDRIAMPGQLVAAHVRIENTGDMVLPGGSVGLSTMFRPVVRDSQGRDIELPRWDGRLGARDLEPGGTTEVAAAFRVPRRVGRYRLLLRLVLWSPRGEREAGLALVGDLEVVATTRQR